MQSRVDALGLLRNQSITMLSSSSPSAAAFLRFLAVVPLAVPLAFPGEAASSAFRLCEFGFVAFVGLPGVVDVCARGLPARPGLGWSLGTFGLVARFATSECPLCVGTGEVGRDPEPPGNGVFT